MSDASQIDQVMSQESLSSRSLEPASTDSTTVDLPPAGGTPFPPSTGGAGGLPKP